MFVPGNKKKGEDSDKFEVRNVSYLPETGLIISRSPRECQTEAKSYLSQCNVRAKAGYCRVFCLKRERNILNLNFADFAKLLLY